MAALLGAALLLGLGLRPGIWGRLPDLCLFHRVTGLDCPTCGLTRSWSALLHGEVGAAFRSHWLGPVLLLALAAFTAASWRERAWPALGRGWAWGLGAVWASYALLRMAGVVPPA